MSAHDPIRNPQSPIPNDPFSDLARHYDAIMGHVDYDRWFLTVSALAELMPESFRHVDAACGTGVLVDMLRNAGWNSTGFDLSFVMVRNGRKQRGEVPLAAADLRALPFTGAVDYLTCLFDSINFLLDASEVRQALEQFSRALSPNGLLYFDIVTERMVTRHFENQTWTEDNGRFKTTWSSTYDHNTNIADTRIRINTGVDSLIRERIYPTGLFEDAIRDAGLTLLGSYDADTWKAPMRRTTRIDFIAVKGDSATLEKPFKKVRASLRRLRAC